MSHLHLLTRKEQVDAGRLALDALRLHLIGLVDHIDDAESRKLLLALAEVETAGRILDELATGPKSEPQSSPLTSNAARTLEASIGQVRGQLDDLHAELEHAAGWCGADSGEEAKPHVLAALVSLGRLREALGFRASVVHASEVHRDVVGGAHG